MPPYLGDDGNCVTRTRKEDDDNRGKKQRIHDAVAAVYHLPVSHAKSETSLIPFGVGSVSTRRQRKQLCAIARDYYDPDPGDRAVVPRDRGYLSLPSDGASPGTRQGTVQAMQ